ncbi:hypothetical protein IFM89_003109 [Coptis chinensis]|uniref:Uncharacterized protein n=1 Tax=Coptis chinensis TaxID=261450 RepID=A0A835IUP1_9MAGN|nr:hypothetical protein IFM89_003109 [Coptis chinensis]
MKSSVWFHRHLVFVLESKETVWSKKYNIHREALSNAYNQILLWCNNDIALFTYDPIIGSLGKIQDHEVQRVSRIEMVPYIKSWVSLKAIGENPRIIGEETEKTGYHFGLERKAKKY